MVLAGAAGAGLGATLGGGSGGGLRGTSSFGELSGGNGGAFPGNQQGQSVSATTSDSTQVCDAQARVPQPHREALLSHGIVCLIF